MSEQHLWDVTHPYYAQEGNFYKAGMHERHASWADFFDEMGNSDEDLNLVYRWDWKQNLDDNEQPEGAPGDGILYVFFMAQRKACCYSHEMPVKAADEPAVREWLQKRWERLRAVWSPFST